MAKNKEETPVSEHEPQSTTVVLERGFENPGIEPHSPERLTDRDPKAAKRAERQVTAWFIASAVASVIAIIVYIAVPIKADDMSTVHPNNLWLGLSIGFAFLAIGIGAVHFAKQLMPAHEMEEDRHTLRSSDETRAEAIEILQTADKESGISRRTVLRRSLIGAAVVAPLPGIVMLRDLAPVSQGLVNPAEKLRHTIWGDQNSLKLVRDPNGRPIKASDVQLGSAFHVIPENLLEIEDHSQRIIEKAKAAVLLVRLPENEIKSGAEDGYHGILAYSKICTHVGCPVALVEQHTHHLLCPCHQSTFDIADGAKVVFGPANRPLPQLPITVDSEGYLVSKGDFRAPVGPSFWEIEK
ncbi:cytochrome bc1 complex Rieske iron-sulfur subunit [Pseudoclavibacter sp. 13-3]|uniref:cytochrome bc1 complex Rieske iron-sulfur subunit n=1 Tax=Pseudoclavibacter sp. 13-3 TaxID=2901228 RepID=UPI001E4886EC|nr:Rieske 2Fe-2S domain-containing protein [Pseudoclavibacter sp. 13-3]MCD7101882.1 Rieske (2Fe-2S) protein [Pseudoclavibacter sp. 13-3]